MTTLKAEDNT